MSVMKRMMALALMLCLALSLCACGGEQPSAETTEPAAPVETAPPAPETEAPVVEEEFDGYIVTVVDEEGNPIAGAVVQLCMDTCFPGITDETGAAKFSMEEADYKVSFAALPAGYTYTTEEQEFHFEAGSKELTITLKAEA